MKHAAAGFAPHWVSLTTMHAALSSVNFGSKAKPRWPKKRFDPSRSRPRRIADAGDADGSFSAAARTLKLSQPAVSLQIRQLKNRLAVRLVERLGKHAYATAAGEELIAHARRLAQEADQALAAMRRHRERAT